MSGSSLPPEAGSQPDLHAPKRHCLHRGKVPRCNGQLGYQFGLDIDTIITE
jgi:hypothetical protein